MSACAVMLVKDEADIVGYTVRWLLTQVDRVIVSDNGSTDGTRELLDGLYHDHAASGARSELVIHDDLDPAYWQSRKTTALAMEALAAGFDWVVPVDADEFWYAADGRTIGQLLDGVTPDVQVVNADLYNHIPSGRDPADDPCPFTRIGWRQREHGVLGKVAARARPDLVIEAGNHGARFAGVAVRSGGLVIRHYSWRSADQYVRKIRNGEAAYAATNLPVSTGAHWRMWADRPDEALRDHFGYWFYIERPESDATLIYDPAPLRPADVRE